MFVEYGILISHTIKDFFAGTQLFVTGIVHSQLFWPGVCIAALIGIWIYRRL